MTPNDARSLEGASMYLAMDVPALTALARDRHIPSVEVDGGWVLSKKSIDKWRASQAQGRAGSGGRA